MKPAQKTMVIFLDRIKGEKIVRCYVGVIIDVSDISVTVLMRSGKIVIITRETLLEVKELAQ